jgi:hypothetical protein
MSAVKRLLVFAVLFLIGASLAYGSGFVGGGGGLPAGLTFASPTFTIATGAANQLVAKGSATTVAPSLSVTGSDTNINLQLLPKGAAAVFVGPTAAALSKPNIDSGNAFFVTGDGATWFPAVVQVGLTPGNAVPASMLAASRGTLAAPTAVQSGDTLGFIEGLGYGTTDYQFSPFISFIADGTFTDTSAPGSITFSTVPSGSLTAVERLRITSTGGVLLGGTTLTLTAGALGLSKITASGTAAGAAGAKLELVCGTNAGTAKVIIAAGTSATAVTIVDNVGAGVTGC